MTLGSNSVIRGMIQAGEGGSDPNMARSSMVHVAGGMHAATCARNFDSKKFCTATFLPVNLDRWSDLASHSHHQIHFGSQLIGSIASTSPPAE